MGGLGDEASHLADPHPTALTMSVNLTVRYTFQHGPTACSISLMDSVLLGYNGLFILSLSWTSFFSQKRPCDIIRLSTFIHGPYFTLNEPSLLPTVLTSQVILRKQPRPRVISYTIVFLQVPSFSGCHAIHLSLK